MILILFVILSMLSWYKQKAISEFSEVNQLTSISINYWNKFKIPPTEKLRGGRKIACENSIALIYISRFIAFILL